MGTDGNGHLILYTIPTPLHLLFPSAPTLPISPSAPRPLSPPTVPFSLRAVWPGESCRAWAPHFPPHPSQLCTFPMEKPQCHVLADKAQPVSCP